MRELVRAWGIGALSGSRSMLGPAVVAQSAGSPTVRTLLAVCAAGELVADKTSIVGARTEALPLAGRLVLGAAAAAASVKRHRVQAACAGAAGAVAAAYACFQLRRLATTRLKIPNVVAGMVEDAAALGAGAMLTHARR